MRDEQRKERSVRDEHSEEQRKEQQVREEQKKEKSGTGTERTKS